MPEKNVDFERDVIWSPSHIHTYTLFFNKKGGIKYVIFYVPLTPNSLHPFHNHFIFISNRS